MALSPMNFETLDPYAGQKSANEIFRGILANRAQSINNQYMPQNWQNSLMQQLLANQKSQAELPYAGPQAAANLGYTQAQIPNIQAQTGLTNSRTQAQNIQNQMPFGGNYLPGSAGSVQALDAVRQMFGENSPQYQQAQQAYENEQKAALSRMNYQNALAGTIDKRYATPMGKEIIEQREVNAGNLPTGQPVGNKPLPAPKEDISNQYDLKRQKLYTDVDARKKNLFATNIEKTIDTINPDDLATYSGLKGLAEKNLDKYISASGKEVPRYTNYLKAVQASEFLAKQARQFYGDSIQPSMAEKLEKLANPETWSRTPKQAKELFMQTKNILQKELQTYRDAGISRKVYTGQQSSNLPNLNHLSDEQLLAIAGGR